LVRDSPAIGELARRLGMLPSANPVLALSASRERRREPPFPGWMQLIPTAGIVTVGAPRLPMGGVMTKCFFYLKDGSNACVGSLGLRYFDIESAAVYAVAIARSLQGGRAADALVVVATDQKGNEIARAPIARVGEPSTKGRSPYAEPEQDAGREVARVA
jgi:hypothetical protein